MVYVGSYDNRLYAYSAATGALLWSATTGNAIGSSPAVANGMIYVGSDDSSLYAYALNAGNNAVYKGRRKTEPPSFSVLHPDFRLKPAAN